MSNPRKQSFNPLISSDIDLPKSVSLLDSEFRQLITLLKNHPALCRLGKIQQLGYTCRSLPHVTHTRLDHSLCVLDICCQLIDYLSLLSQEVKRHLIATALMMDIGHSPYSNSLQNIFPIFGSHYHSRVPPDIARTIEILSFIETSESLLSKNGLSLNTLISILTGSSPWTEYPWVPRIFDNPFDVDRIAYVGQDQTVITGRSQANYPFELLQSIKFLEMRKEHTIITPDAESLAVNFIAERGRLYTDIYLSRVKIALETLMQDYVTLCWNNSSSLPSISLRKPIDIPQFIRWNDQVVDSLISMVLPNSASPLLIRFQKNLFENSFLVADVETDDNAAISDERIQSVEIPHYPADLFWLLSPASLPSFKFYTPGSIIIKEKTQHQPIEKSYPLFNRLSKPFFHKPMAIFSSVDKYKLDDALKKNDLFLGMTVRIVSCDNSCSF